MRAGEMGKRVSIVGPTEALSCRPLVGESDSDLHFHPVRPEGFEPPTFGLEVRPGGLFVVARHYSESFICPGRCPISWVPSLLLSFVVFRTRVSKA